jgi:hypothetical protein
MDPMNLTCTVIGVALITGGILVAVSGHREAPDEDVDPEHPPTGIHL